MIRALTPRWDSAIKQLVIVWGVQLRVLARRDVIVRANRNKEAGLPSVT